MARYVSGEARPDWDALEVRWATGEELDTLDMHPVARKTVRQAFEMASELGLFCGEREDTRTELNKQ